MMTKRRTTERNKKSRRVEEGIGKGELIERSDRRSFPKCLRSFYILGPYS